MAKLDDSNLALHMDKISYGVAAVVGLAILVLAFMSGGDLRKTITDIRDQRTNLETRMRERPPESPPSEIEAIIANQWQVRPAALEYPKWTTHRVPSLAQWVAQKEGIRAEHGDPQITRISYKRNPDNWQVYLEVEAEFGKLKYAEITGAKLARKVGDGDFEELPFGDEQSIGDGALTYRDDNVEPGKVYTYQLTTAAKPVPVNGQDVVLPPAEKEKTSVARGIAKPIPVNYRVRMQYARPFDASKPDSSDILAGVIEYGSDEPGGQPVRVSFPEGRQNYPVGFKFGPLIKRAGRKVRLFEILEIAKEDEVKIKIGYPRRTDNVTRDNQDDRDVILPMPIEFSDVAAEPTGEEPSGEPEEPAEPEPTEPETETTEPKKTEPKAEEPKKKKKGPFK